MRKYRARTNPQEATTASQIGMLTFPGLNQLDLTGPFEVLEPPPGARRSTCSGRTPQPVRSDIGLELRADDDAGRRVRRSTCVFVPGGFGQWAMQTDEVVLGFLRDHGPKAR